MRLPDASVVTFVLGCLGVFGTLFGTWLSRRGKKEDIRLAQKAQAFSELVEVADQRLKDISRLETRNTFLENEMERVRKSWEDRWERQMKRCRAVTEALVRAITALRLLAGPAAKEEADHVMVLLEEHNQDDHPDTMSNT